MRIETVSEGPNVTRSDKQRFCVRLMDLVGKWLKEHRTVDAIHELLGIEQLLTSLPTEKRLWLVERKPKTCVQAGEWLDEYDQVRRLDRRAVRQTSPRDGFVGKETGGDSRAPEQQRGGHQRKFRPRCFTCQQVGHVASRCPKSGNYFVRSRKAGTNSKTQLNTPRLEGTVEGLK